MWRPGDLILRRELLGHSPVGPPAEPRPWYGRSWLDLPVYVVADDDEALVTYVAPGAEFGFHPGPWPTEDGLHPWQPNKGWQGEGCLMVQAPGEHFAVWHFWHPADEHGPRRLWFWYVNIQTAFLRTERGYDTQDLEVDMVVSPDGSWTLKDYEVLAERTAAGRFWPELDTWIRDYTTQISARLDQGPWWDDRWVDWSPPAEWRNPRLADVGRSG